MYSYEWAKNRVQEHLASHTRATVILREGFGLTPETLIDFLRNSMIEWETYKGLVRHVESCLGIRAKPNSTEHLNSNRAFSTIKHILQSHARGEGGGLWTGIPFFVKLGERVVWEAEPLAQLQDEDRRAFDGQLYFFEGGVQ